MFESWKKNVKEDVGVYGYSYSLRNSLMMLPLSPFCPGIIWRIILKHDIIFIAIPNLIAVLPILREAL